MNYVPQTSPCIRSGSPQNVGMTDTQQEKKTDFHPQRGAPATASRVSAAILEAFSAQARQLIFEIP